MFWQTLIGMWEGMVARTPYILVALLVVLIFAALARLASRAVRYAIRLRNGDAALAVALGQLTSGAIFLLGLLVGAVVVFPAFKPGDLVAGLGITSVAIGFAFKDILQNFLAGLLILWRRPFTPGDEIQTRGFEGTVEEIRVRSTYIRTYQGERVIVPNSEVYSNAVLVRTALESRRVEITLGIGYDQDLELALRTLRDRLPSIDGVLDDPGPWVYVTRMGELSADITLYFWVHPPQANVLAMTDRVALSARSALLSVGIDLPETQRIELVHSGGSAS